MNKRCGRVYDYVGVYKSYTGEVGTMQRCTFFNEKRVHLVKSNASVKLKRLNSVQRYTGETAG